MNTPAVPKSRPQMTRWFDPILLAKLLLQVVVSGLFSRYADRRLVLAALDKDDTAALKERAKLGLTPDAEGAIWFDYVSDLGDGFDATYAVAYCLAQDRLAVDHLSLPRGQLLVMGGDEVYPTSSRDAYKDRLRDPYRDAFPVDDQAPRPPVFMIPGNHDWYDGLVSFLALFCRSRPTSVGNYQAIQRRSYFAIELKPGWWIWAIDIALTEDMDQPQADYFITMAAAMPQRARIILCTAEPGWYDADTKAAAFRTLDYAAKLADNAGRDFKIIVALSGDTHHYARYVSGFGTQFVTSGGGGAFLHGTHSLGDTITLDWLKQKHQSLTLAACYPSREQSRELLKGDFLFPVHNPEFAALLGVVYWLCAVAITAHWSLASEIIVALVIWGGFSAYFGYQERGKVAAAKLDPEEEPDEMTRTVKAGTTILGVQLPPLLQSAAHFVTLFLLAWLFAEVNARYLGVATGGWASFFLLAPEMILFGGAAAGFIFGVNLFVNSRYLDMSHNDAFSAMRLDSYRQFMRLRLVGDDLTIYPIGIDRVPQRDEWVLNPNYRQPPIRSRYLAPPSMKPRLIEPPILIAGDKVAPITEAVKPAELTGVSEPVG